MDKSDTDFDIVDIHMDLQRALNWPWAESFKQRLHATINGAIAAAIAEITGDVFDPAGGWNSVDVIGLLEDSACFRAVTALANRTICDAVESRDNNSPAEAALWAMTVSATRAKRIAIIVTAAADYEAMRGELIAYAEEITRPLYAYGVRSIRDAARAKWSKR